MILLSLLLLSTSISITDNSPIPDALVASTDDQSLAKPITRALVDSALYGSAGALLSSSALIAGAGWLTCQLFPWSSPLGNECRLSGEIFAIGALHSFEQMFKNSPLLSLIFKKPPSSYASWFQNQALLSQIPSQSLEDKKLLSFLQERWLAKITGCYPFLLDWMCPAFGISLQAHPQTTNSYARDPHNKLSQTYKNRIAAWKKFLPQPQHFPLILTRPYNIGNYLPNSLEIPQNEQIEQALVRLASAAQKTTSSLVVDVTSLLPSYTVDRKSWLSLWQTYEKTLSDWCKEQQLDLNRIICIQRLDQENIGGIRLLPFASSSKQKIESDHQFLLEWIGKYGLSANRIELDRLSVHTPSTTHAPVTIPLDETKETWLSFLNSFNERWETDHPQKDLMLKATLRLLQDFSNALSPEKWEDVRLSPTRSSAAQLSFKKIKQQLNQLVQEDRNMTFYETITRLELVHADLSSLLEIFSPFVSKDFAPLFRNHLTSIPVALKPYTKYGLNTSAMTSLAGIFKALENTLGRPAHILYGENTYFECIHVVDHTRHAALIQEATEEQWSNVDLIIAQFNPALKRIDFKVSEYHVEKITDVVKKALTLRGERPLTVAIDSTLDFSNSHRIGEFLGHFQNEIENGYLNVISYRSGSKFDLLGMDNYCGAPFIMVHNNDKKWDAFACLLNDPALQTDPLSINWFCLAFQNAAPYLEAYRKQIFENTRTVLSQVPQRLYSELPYRIIPIASDADPSFIDVKIFGPMHEFRGGLLVGTLFTIKCMEAGHPLLYRPSLGFYHPNLAVLFGKDFTTVRLTVGLDASQVQVISDCIEKINELNGSPEQIVENQIQEIFEENKEMIL